MKRFWLWLKTFLSETWENYAKSSIATGMWIEGYTDWEIDEEIQQRFPEKNSAE